LCTDPEDDFEQWQQAVFDLFQSTNMQLDDIPLASPYTDDSDAPDSESESDLDSSLDSPDSQFDEAGTDEIAASGDGGGLSSRSKLARQKLESARRRAQGEKGDDIEDLGKAMPALKQALAERMEQQELSDSVAKVSLGKTGTHVPKEVRPLFFNQFSWL
jgi:hypothetical protein